MIYYLCYKIRPTYLSAPIPSLIYLPVYRAIGIVKQPCCLFKYIRAVIYHRGINIVLLILSFLAVHLYGATVSKNNCGAACQQQPSPETTRFTVTKDIAKVLASGEGNSSEFLFQRIQHQQPQHQAKVPVPYFFCLFSPGISFSESYAGVSGVVAPITGFIPVVYKLLYPKHWFW